MVNAMSQLLYPWGKRHGTHCTEGWVEHRAGLDQCRKSHLHWDSIPGLGSEGVQQEANGICGFATVYLVYVSVQRAGGLCGP
jgi:hypothetical protein